MARNYSWLDLDIVNKLAPLARRRGVSEVARSARGFLPQYRRAKGHWRKLTEAWQKKRNAFVARHMAQVRANDEKLWNDKGEPTDRHLALIMWAYSPESYKIKQYLRRSARKPRKNPWVNDNGEWVNLTPPQYKLFDRLKDFKPEYAVRVPSEMRLRYRKLLEDDFPSLLDTLKEVPDFYYLDLAHPRKKLAIEVDGKSHLRERDKMKDAIRDDILSELGWTVYRYDNDALMDDPDAAAQEIKQFLKRHG